MGLIPDDPDDLIGADEGAMNKTFNYTEILLRHQLIFLGGVPLHPEARSGLR
jgi:hypothetical protein